ncbi:hypothetical protein ABPG77_009484 [Micractinium sp. CCAP 211/92]
MMGGLSDNRCPLSGTAVVRGPFVLRNPSGGTFALSATQTALCPCGVVTSVRFYTLDSNDGLRVVYYTDASRSTGYVESALMYVVLACSDGTVRSLGRDQYQGLDVLADLFGSNPGAVINPMDGMPPTFPSGGSAHAGMALRGLTARVGTYTPSSGQPAVPVMRYVSAICGDLVRTPARCA